MTARRVAVGGLALGLAIALAANLTYAVPRGGVVIGLGLIAPLVLPVVLHLRTTFTVDGFWAKAVREVATLAVAGPAVAVSYSHTMQLVLDAGEPRLIALLAPLSSDGLAGLATLALYTSRSGLSVSASALGSEFGLTVAAAKAPTYVYRLLSAEGVLLYVGITADLKSRLNRHRAGKSWWPQVDEVATERYPNRAAALAVEQSAIANEHPTHNKAKGSLRDAVGGAVHGRVERNAVKVTPASTPADGPTDAPAPSPAAPAGAVDDELARAIELVDAARASGRRYGRGQLARDLGCTPDRARKLLERIDEGRPVHLVGVS